MLEIPAKSLKLLREGVISKQNYSWQACKQKWVPPEEFFGYKIQIILFDIMLKIFQDTFSCCA